MGNTQHLREFLHAHRGRRTGRHIVDEYQHWLAMPVTELKEAAKNAGGIKSMPPSFNWRVSWVFQYERTVFIPFGEVRDAFLLLVEVGWIASNGTLHITGMSPIWNATRWPVDGYRPKDLWFM